MCVWSHAFLLLRNSTNLFRQHYFAFPAQLGRISLESYLLQYHIWLACSATRLLVIVPGLPKVNLVATSAVFLLAANILFEKTSALRVLLFADAGAECVVVVCKMLLGLLGFNALGTLVCRMELLLAAGPDRWFCVMVHELTHELIPGTLVCRMEMPLAAGFLSLVLALGASHHVKRSAALHQRMQESDDEENAEQELHGLQIEGLTRPTQRSVHVWMGAASAALAVAYVAVLLSGMIERDQQEKVPVYRVPEGQYSDVLLALGTCIAAALLLAATSRVPLSSSGSSS